MAYKQRRNVEPVDYRTPVDDLEPIEQVNAYREAARRFAFFMNRAAIYTTGAENARLHAWAVALAFGLQCCEGKTYTEIGVLCGVGKAAVSKAAKFFCEANSLPPSFNMKSADATRAYKESRIKSINDANKA